MANEFSKIIAIAEAWQTLPEELRTAVKTASEQKEGIQIDPKKAEPLVPFVTGVMGIFDRLNNKKVQADLDNVWDWLDRLGVTESKKARFDKALVEFIDSIDN